MSLLWILASANAAVVSPQPEIIVTGSRVATAPEDLAANVTVLERTSFEAEKPVALADVLRRVSGVHMDSVGGRGGTGSLYLRGADPNYTLVLIDGVRVNDPTNARGGSFDFSTLDVSDIERVEIARGPYSAVYGGDALAGVINIVTRRANAQRTEASADVMAGTRDTSRAALNLRGPMAHGGWNLGVSDLREGETVRGNRFDGQRVSAGFNSQLGQATTLTLSGRHSQTSREGFPDDSGGYEFAALRELETRESAETVLGAALSTRQGSAEYSLSVAWFSRDEQIESPGVAPGLRDPFGIPPNNADSDITRFTATLSGSQKFSDALSVAYGVEWQRESGRSDGELDFGGGFVLPTRFDVSRTSWAPFAEARIATTFGLSAQAGVRVDQPEDRSSVTSPRARLAYEFAGDLTLAASWGKAFKLPSLYALGNPIVGNPDLLPERGQSRELELSQQLSDGRLRWSATYFDSEFRNAIDFDAGPPPMLVNRNRVDSQGFELAARFAADEAWQFDASVTQARSRIASTNGELRNRPEWRAGAGVHFAPLTALRFSASANYVGAALDSSVATSEVRLSAYTRVDVSAAWQISPRFEAYLAVDNLTDEKYQQFVGFESRGIAPRVGVELSL